MSIRVNIEQLPAHLRAQLVGESAKQAKGTAKDPKKRVRPGVPLVPGGICESYRDRMFPEEGE